MTLYELRCEFDVARRIGWADEDLARHVDEVLDTLRQGKGVLSMDVDAHMDTGRVHLSVRFESLTTDDPQHHGSALLGVAIRRSGAMHDGLLPLGEEALLRPERGQWSGLRTPLWTVRQVSVAETSTSS